MGKNRNTANNIANWNRDCGQRLKDLRIQKGMSQGQLCEAAAIPSIKELVKLENGSGRSKNVRFDALCGALSTSMNYLMYGKPAAENHTAESHTAESREDRPVLFPGDSVGERLKLLREDLKMSLNSIAEVADIGVTGPMIGRYEKGLNMISEEKLRRFAALYSCTVENLATEEELEEIRKHDADPFIIQTRMAKETHKLKKKREQDKRAAADPAAQKAEKPAAEKAAADPVSGELPVQKAAEKKAVSDEAVKPATEKPVTQEPDAEAEAHAASVVQGAVKTELTGNALNFAIHVAIERKRKGIKAEDAARALGMTPEEYRDFENGLRDITISQLSLLGKVLMISPVALISDSFTKEWFMFRSESPKELYAALGACIEHNIEFVNDIVDNGAMQIFGCRQEISRIFTNLKISGTFI